MVHSLWPCLRGLIPSFSKIGRNEQVILGFGVSDEGSFSRGLVGVAAPCAVLVASAVDGGNVASVDGVSAVAVAGGDAKTRSCPSHWLGRVGKKESLGGKSVKL